MTDINFCFWQEGEMLIVEYNNQHREFYGREKAIEFIKNMADEVLPIPDVIVPKGTRAIVKFPHLGIINYHSDMSQAWHDFISGDCGILEYL